MKTIRRFIGVPVLLLVLGVLAFGVQAGWLGAYLDDWVVLYHIYRGGYERLAAYSFGVNRPLGAWPWWVGFSILGYAPALWQLWSLAWRVLTAVFLWQGWKRIFPEKKTEVALACALFVVYPVFLQQPEAVTFSDHWMCFALYALSVWLMALAVRRPRWFYPLTLLALAASGLELFALEYFVGLEMIRPLLLWFLLRDIPKPRARLKQTVLHALPYAALLVIFLAWRFVWMPTPGFDRNRPELLYNLLHSPLKAAAALAVTAAQDTVQALTGAWYPAYAPASITPTPVSALLAWGWRGRPAWRRRRSSCAGRSRSLALPPRGSAQARGSRLVWW